MDRPVLAAVLVAALALAGCTTTPPSSDDQDADPRVMPLPSWDLGRSWTYTLTVPGFGSRDIEMAYGWDTDVRPDWKHYMLGASRDHAIFHAVFDINPFLGRIHSTLLSPHEDGSHSAMFDFPLEPDEDPWVGAPDQVFFGRSRTFESTYSEEVPGPDGPTRGYELVARGDDGSVVEYNYVPEVKWLTHLRAEDADGRRIVEISLVEAGSGSTEKGYFVRPRVFGEINQTFQAGVGQTETFEVEEIGDYGAFEYLAVGVRIRPGGDVGQVDIEIQDPDGQSRWNGTVTADQGATNEVVTISPQGTRLKGGTWTVQVDALQSAHLWLEANGAWEYCGRNGEELDCP